MTVDHLIIFASWVIYYSFHSILVADSVKIKVQNIGLNLRVWRVLYSLISIVGLLAILLLIAITPSMLIWNPNDISKFFGMVFATYGVIIIRVSFRNYSLSDFLIRDNRFKDGDELKTTGLQAKIRHPLYSGTVLVLLGMMFFIPKYSSVVTLIATLLYLPIGMWLEEKKLMNKFGNQYIEYKKKVPALIPKFWQKKL